MRPRFCRARGIAEDRGGLPAGLRRLLELAEAVPEKKGARSEAARVSFFTRVGNATLGYGLSVNEFLSFLGELTLAFGKFFRGKARYRTDRSASKSSSNAAPTRSASSR